MEGGTITGNKTTEGDGNVGGGGVGIGTGDHPGTFILQGGSILGNTAANEVRVNTGTFTLSGGRVVSKSASAIDISMDGGNSKLELSGNPMVGHIMMGKGSRITLVDTSVSDDYLSDFEENLLGSVSDQFYGYSYEDMKNYSHTEGRFPEWTPVKKGEEMPIPLENIMKAVGISDTEIKILIDEQKVFEEEAALFHTH